MGSISQFHRRSNFKKPGNPNAFGYKGGFKVTSGNIVISGQQYELIVASKVLGGESPTALAYSSEKITKDVNRYDGWTNSNTLNSLNSSPTKSTLSTDPSYSYTNIQNSLYPAAAFCRTLNIGGYSDWYLPSYEELILMYRSFKPNLSSLKPNSTTNNNGTTTSTNPLFSTYTASIPNQTSIIEFQDTNTEAFQQNYYISSSQAVSPNNANNAALLNFFNGSETQNLKTDSVTQYARAVRRIAI